MDLRKEIGSKYQVTCQKNSDNSGNSYFKHTKCISGSNSFPEGDRCILNAVLNTHTEHGNGELLLSGIGGSPGKFFNLCQTQGNLCYQFLQYFILYQLLKGAMV